MLEVKKSTKQGSLGYWWKNEAQAEDVIKLGLITEELQFIQ